MNNELLEVMRVLEECSRLARVHEKLLAGPLPITEALRSDLTSGLSVIAAKLEHLRKELLLRD